MKLSFLVGGVCTTAVAAMACGCNAPETAPPSLLNTAPKFGVIQTIPAHQAGEMLQQSNTKMLDVREPSEWNEGHVKGSVLVPLGEVEKTPKKGVIAPRVLIMCRSGRRSMSAAQAMKNEKNVRLFVIEGGILAWKKAGLPVQKGK